MGGGPRAVNKTQQKTFGTWSETPATPTSYHKPLQQGAICLQESFKECNTITPTKSFHQQGTIWLSETRGNLTHSDAPSSKLRSKLCSLAYCAFKGADTRTISASGPSLSHPRAMPISIVHKFQPN